ncbi:MAG: hypothetical protein OXF00_13995 [bacterium]|nr:hypothetical protein [bacterium]
MLVVALIAAACGDDGGDPARVANVLDRSGTPGASASPSAPHGSATPTVSPAARGTATATRAPTAVATPVASMTPTAAATPVATADTASDGQAAMDAWALVFDSAVDFSEKTSHLEDAASLESSNAGYAVAAQALGGIRLEPTAAEVDGDAATITYNVLFGENPAYEDLTGEIQRVNATWTVSREAYCGFLSSARAPCS